MLVKEIDERAINLMLDKNIPEGLTTAKPKILEFKRPGWFCTKSLTVTIKSDRIVCKKIYADGNESMISLLFKNL